MNSIDGRPRPVAPLERLRDILYAGIAPDILLGQRARELHRVIGERADGINAAGFGDLFGAIQDAAVGELTLSITKLFERPNAKYPTRSIPAALEVLQADAAVLPVTQEVVGIADLVRAGVSGEVLEGKRGQAYTATMAEQLKAICPDPSKAASCELSGSLDALRTRRDKAVAHNEAVDSAAFAPITWHEAERLLAFAKNVLGALGITFFGSAFTANDGSFTTDFDAGRAARQIDRLLKRAGVV